ncbi:MAG TPA: DUF1552 domain-containing protein [Opitutaceae bacterium]|nr:DUF1552 domain-containing protein [Opitutaceae bacterium]
MSSNWQIPRRTFLRGVGTAIALPVLDAMLPTRLFGATAPATAAGFPKRMAFVYVPNGMNMSKWAPLGVGADYQLSPTLEPLAAYKSDFSILSGLAHRKAFGNGDGGGDHARASATYLTGTQAKKSASDIHIGVSVDQVAAKAIGDQTRFPSLELSCDRGQEAGSCDSGYSCAYQFNISWRSETQPMNPEIEPKAAFDRLFGTGSPDESREARLRRERQNRSILDLVLDQTHRLERNLGRNDRQKLDEYLTAIRDVEKRIEQNGRMPPPVPDGAAAAFEGDYTFERHMRLMFDVMALSFQTDSTRVASFLVSHDGGNRPYPFAGVNAGHHSTSHHRNNPDALDKLAKIDRWHLTQFGYFLEKLKSVKEGDGTLLDNCMIVYGAGISDPNEHLHDNLPTILAGRGGGTLTPGRHIQLERETPMTNLFTSLLDRVGAPVPRFGDSTGKLEAIA